MSRARFLAIRALFRIYAKNSNKTVSFLFVFTIAVLEQAEPAAETGGRVAVAPLRATRGDRGRWREEQGKTPAPNRC